MGRRVKELEQAIEQRDGEIAQLRRRVDELSADVEKYRLQESAIAGALTRAQAAADRMLKEAGDEKTEMIRQANEEKLEIETEAKGILVDAQRRAEIIEQDAKQKAHDAARRVEAFMTQYRASAQQLITEFRHIASDATGRVKSFSDYMNGLNLDEAVEITREYDHVSAMDETPAQDMPDDYADPASLMRSIYAIEHRDIPVMQAAAGEEKEPSSDAGDTENAEKEPEPEIEKEPVPEIVPPPAPEPVPQRTPEYQPTPAPEPGKILNAEQAEKPKETDPFTSWARPEEKAEEKAAEEAGRQEKADWEKESVDLDQQEDDEHVWTVEEIVERTNANENAQIDDELNAIIEDVLKGS